MAFTLTHFIYPLQDKIVLSESMGYEIDNPRGQEEVDLIRGFIIKSVNWGEGDENYNQSLAVAYGLNCLVNYLKSNDKTAFDIIQGYDTESTIEIIARAWIIFRYSDDGSFEKVWKNEATLIPIIYGSSTDHPFFKSFQQAIGYTGLISLLLNDNDFYYGENLIPLRFPQEVFFANRGNDLYHVLEDFKHAGIFLNEGKVVNEKWKWFPFIVEDLIQISGLLEGALVVDKNGKKSNSKKSNREQTPKEKLLFVGNLLRVILHETYDTKVKLLLLVSIIEFLLTRNPNFDRFNVEDSISKQFTLKAATLIYLNDKQRSLEKIRDDLKVIYAQRSNIAHGNYISQEEEESYLNSLQLLYVYIKAILEEYLIDRNFVDFLKQN